MDADPAAEAQHLRFGLSFDDLADRPGLVRLDRAFLAHLAAEDTGLHARLLAVRADPAALEDKAASDLIVALGPHVDAYVAALFGIEDAVLALARRTHALDPVHACKRLFVQRQAVKKHPDPAGFDGPALRAALEARMGAPLTDLGFATNVAAWEAAADVAAIDLALRYAAWAALTASSASLGPVSAVASGAVASSAAGAACEGPARDTNSPAARINAERPFLIFIWQSPHLPAPEAE